MRFHKIGKILGWQTASGIKFFKSFLNIFICSLVKTHPPPTHTSLKRLNKRNPGLKLTLLTHHACCLIDVLLPAGELCLFSPGLRTFSLILSIPDCLFPLVLYLWCVKVQTLQCCFTKTRSSITSLSLSPGWIHWTVRLLEHVWGFRLSFSFFLAQTCLMCKLDSVLIEPYSLNEHILTLRTTRKMGTKERNYFQHILWHVCIKGLV